MAKHIVIIDGNSLAHANHNTTPLTVGGMQVQAIFGFLRSLKLIHDKYPGDREVLILWDGKAQFRLDLHPDYKGNRKALDDEGLRRKEAFKKQTPFIEKAVELLGIRQMRSPVQEADDLAGHLVPRLANCGKQVTLCSGDQDWLQLVGPNVSWFDFVRDRKVDQSNFLEFTGYFTPAAFVQGKALVGDTSDNIPGVPKLGDKGAALFLAKFKSVEEFWRQVDSGEHVPATRKSKTATSVHPEEFLASPEGRALFKRNMALMDFKQSPTPAPGELIVVAKPPEPEKFLHLCERLAFASILRERHAFLRSFGISLT